MKIDETVVQAVTSEEFKTTAFRVDQKMAQVLFRDKLYTAEGKLRVIPQEYMANARDAHRAAGKSDTPIDVTLPTLMNPEFIVRDYGNGIPEKIVEDIFVVYGATTKDKSQLENGGYGIGAKSAFSYVNAFSVTTTVQGVRYIYAASIDSGGMNQFTLLDKGPATGPDGTEIRVPIRANDISTLKTWVAEITHQWVPRPNFTGGTPVAYNDVQPERSGVGWELYAPNVSPFGYRSRRPGILVTADDIPYSITGEQVDTIGGNTEKLYRILMNDHRQLVMHFKVGEVLIPPQRESVDMTAKSAAAIDKAADLFIKAMLDSAQAQLRKATTVVERVALALNEEFDMRVAQELALPLDLDMTVLNAVIDTDAAGMRVYHGRWSRMFNEFDECSTVTFKDLLRPRTRNSNTFLVDMVGKKMPIGELKRLIRGKAGGLDYGDVHVVAVYDRAACEKTLGLTIQSLESIGKYKFCARDPTVVRERYGDSGHVFMKTLSAGYNGYRNTLDTSVNRGKKANLSRHEVYIDYEGSQPLYKGKPVSFDEIGHLAMLLELLKSNQLSSTHVCFWEPRFEQRAPPSEFTFLEDAIQEAAEEALKKPNQQLAMLAFSGALAYKPSPDWPIAQHNQSYVADAFEASGVFNPLFLSVLKSVLALEQAHSDEEETSQAVFVKKLWDILEVEVGTSLTTACQVAVQHVYDVRDEFMAFAYGAPTRALLIADAAYDRATKLRVQGKEVRVEWTSILTETLKSYTPKNPLFKKPNP